MNLHKLLSTAPKFSTASKVAFIMPLITQMRIFLYQTSLALFVFYLLIVERMCIVNISHLYYILKCLGGSCHAYQLFGEMPQ